MSGCLPLPISTVYYSDANWLVQVSLSLLAFEVVQRGLLARVSGFILESLAVHSPSQLRLTNCFLDLSQTDSSYRSVPQCQ
jgi:hypothetical protein